MCIRDRAKRGGSDVYVCGNYISCIGAQCRDQLSRSVVLQRAGIKFYLVAGTDIQQEYKEIGKKVRPGKGILHMKTALVGDWLVLGSTNFTTEN